LETVIRSIQSNVLFFLKKKCIGMTECNLHTRIKEHERDANTLNPVPSLSKHLYIEKQHKTITNLYKANSNVDRLAKESCYIIC